MDINPIVSIIEDEPLVCRSLRQLFQSVGLECSCYSTAPEFLAAYDPCIPTCIIIDIRLPGMSGMELQEKLVERGNTHPVIFLTAYGDVPLAVRAMKYGAVDFIEKPFSEQSLLDVVWRTIHSHMEAWKNEKSLRIIKSRLELLSPREREVLSLVVSGKPTKQIAGILGLSHKTIDNHRASILEKMNADGVVDLVRLTLMADPVFRKKGYARLVH